MEILIDLTNKLSPRFKEASFAVANSLHRAGYEAFLVGGSVRDLLLNRPLADLDFTTNAVPKEIMRVFPKTIPIGIEYGTVLVIYKKMPIEVTTYRTDSEYHDHRRPSHVNFGKDLKQDVLRRDFTVNGMAYDLRNKILVDMVGGLKDIKKKKIRTIGNAGLRFREDGLRMIRACRFTAVFKFSLSMQTKKAVKKSRSSVQNIARERFYDEWKKVSKGRGQHTFWKLLYKLNIFDIFMGHILFFKDRKRRKSFFFLLKSFSPLNMGMYLAYFFEFEYFFENKGHRRREDIKKIIKDVGGELRFPSQEIRIAGDYIDSPLFSLLKYKNWNPIRVFPLAYLIASIEEKELESHVHFFLAVSRTKIKKKKDIKKLEESLKRNIKVIKLKGLPISKKHLKINGHDLSRVGYKKEEIGRELKKLHKIIIRKPSFNKREILMQLANKHSQIQ